MEMLFLIFILGLSSCIVLFFAWKNLHDLREAAKAALTVAGSAVETEHELYDDLNTASRDVARHERGVHVQVNRD